MNEPRWLTAAMVLAFHSNQIREHGGSLGLRDRGLLESALDRPRNKHHYAPDTELVELASAYCFGIARNHPFVDGNKRVAFQAMYVFLRLNQFMIEAEEPEVVRVVLALAAGELDELGLTDWLKDHTVAT
ncbi:type II toxin-antitoxin system death-on-curing family toxin [soil metagenome]